MNDSIGEMYVEIKVGTIKLEKELRQLSSRMDRDAEKMGKAFGDKFNSGLKNMLKLGAGLIGLHQAVDFGRKILNTASEFEQLQTRLVSLYQDTEKAGIVFNKFKKIASTTPFSLKGVVEAGATLKAFGVDAENTLKPVTDLAAYMGLDVVEAANAVGRAFAGGAGAADILRERGVLNLIKDFKGIEDLSKITLPEFRKALIESMQDPAAGIAGSTDRMSKTFEGAFSNMSDSAENFAAWLGQKILPALTGVSKGIEGVFTSLTPTINELETATQKASEQKVKFEQLAGTYLNLKEKINLTNAEQQIMEETIGSLQREYPNYLGNINLEKAGYDDAKAAIMGAREELDKYLQAVIKKGAIQANEEKVLELGKKAFELTTQRIRAEEKLKNLTEDQKSEKVSSFSGENRIGKGFGVDNKSSEGSLLQSEIDTQNNLIQEIDVQTKELRDETIKVMASLEEVFDLVVAPKGENGGGGKKVGSDVIKQYTEALKQLSALKPENMKTPGFEAPSELQSKALPIDPVEFEKSTEAIVENWVRSTEIMSTSFDSVANGIAQSMHELIHVRVAKDASNLEKIFANVANSIIAQIQQIIAKWAVLNAISFVLGGGGISLGSMLGIPKAANGGTFMGTTQGVTKMADGGSFIVPPGHANDTYPLLLRSGEKATITPSHQVNGGGGSDSMNQGIYDRLGALNANFGEFLSRQNKPQKQLLEAELSNEGIYLSNKRGAERYKRYH